MSEPTQADNGRALLSASGASTEVPSIALDVLPEKPIGWTSRMALHFNFGGGKGAAQYRLFDELGRHVRGIGYAYDTRPGGGYGFFLESDESPKQYLTWPQLREAYAARRQA